MDIHYTNHGSLITMRPLTNAAREWIAEHLPEDVLTFGSSYVAIEPRYFSDIAYGAQEDGLESNVRVEPR